ncbi:MAG: nucleotidyltransferase domain-containing protein [Acidobacteria bacterium]|jgi:predicted nucleotidyltransferase|nr:nucleotidyltransferase domain-containing protein [Acidobacteriota bacterium]
MRLTEYEVTAIKESVYLFDPDAKIYLFGSRVDDMKKGGDIDLIVISKRITGAERRKIKLNIYNKIGEQKIDMIITPGITTTFHRIAISTGVQL